MSRLIPGRPPMSEDEFARKFRPGQPANPLAAALERPAAPAYQPPAAEDVARTAMAASPHAAMAGGAMTGGRVVEGVRQRTAPAADPLPAPDALRAPMPVGGPDAAQPEPAFAPGPAAPAIFGQPAGFDPTTIPPPKYQLGEGIRFRWGNAIGYRLVRRIRGGGGAYTAGEGEAAAVARYFTQGYTYEVYWNGHGRDVSEHTILPDSGPPADPR